MIPRMRVAHESRITSRSNGLQAFTWKRTQTGKARPGPEPGARRSPESKLLAYCHHDDLHVLSKGERLIARVDRLKQGASRTLFRILTECDNPATGGILSVQIAERIFISQRQFPPKLEPLATRKYQAAFLSRPRLTRASAICTVLRAAPLRRLSETTHRLRPFSIVPSSRMRDTNVAKSPTHSTGVT